jgi:hypothetical protein
VNIESRYAVLISYNPGRLVNIESSYAGFILALAHCKSDPWTSTDASVEIQNS